MTTDVATEAVEGELETHEKGLSLNIGDESFRCRRISVSWDMMTFGAAQQRAARAKPIHKDNPDGTPHNCAPCKDAAEERNAAGMEMMAAMRALVLKIIVDSDRNRFLNFMDTAVLENDEFERAIGEVIGKLGNQDSKGPKAKAKH